MEHEREPFGRRQPVEDDEKRRPDGVGELSFVFGVTPRRNVLEIVGELRACGLFAPSESAAVMVTLFRSDPSYP